jgi:DNA-binding NarL/FixJ family response regulator
MTAKDGAVISVAIMEDDANYRRIAVEQLGASGRCQVTGEYGSAEAALASLPQAWPQVLLCDINLPGESGITAVQKLQALNPSLACVILTVFDDSEKLFASLQAGAVGYLLKSDPASVMIDAVAEAAAGGSPMSRAIARKVVKHFSGGSAAPVAKPGALAALTPREAEVLARLAEGARYKEIADQLGISIETVKNHLRKIYEKLHVSSRTEATAKFLRG